MAIGALALIVVMLLVLTLGERGALVPVAESAPAMLPDFTMADQEGAAPVITSLRSGGEAQRGGLRVGDRIDAVDGRPVRSVAGLRAALGAGDLSAPVALHVTRGDSVWRVAIGRGASAPEIGTQSTRRAHDPQNPAG